MNACDQLTRLRAHRALLTADVAAGNRAVFAYHAFEGSLIDHIRALLRAGPIIGTMLG